jgi:hypothetical protein
MSAPKEAERNNRYISIYEYSVTSYISRESKAKGD